MIKQTAAYPPLRQKKIDEGVYALHGSNDQALLNSWGVTIEPQMVTVPARLLPTPTILFAEGKSTRPFNGGWKVDSGLLFSSASSLSAWSIAVFGSERDCGLQAINRYFSSHAGLQVLLMACCRKRAYGCTGPAISLKWSSTSVVEVISKAFSLKQIK